jgi:hypothetical protein
MSDPARGGRGDVARDGSGDRAGSGSGDLTGGPEDPARDGGGDVGRGGSRDLARGGPGDTADTERTESPDSQAAPVGRHADPSAQAPARPADDVQPTREGLDGAAAEEAEQAAARRRERAVSGTLAAGLILEGITVLFVPMAIARVAEDGISGTQLTLLLLLAAALFAAAGLQRRRVGPVVGSVLQLAVLATGVLTPAMYFLGLLFAGVWGYLLWVRQEIARAAARATPG